MHASSFTTNKMNNVGDYEEDHIIIAFECEKFSQQQGEKVAQ